MTLAIRVMALATWQQAVESEAALEHPSALAALLAVQQVQGYVSPEALEAIQRRLVVPQAELFGVLGFYHDLRTTAPGRHLVRVCQGDSCHAKEGTAILEGACKSLRIEAGKTTHDGRVSLDVVYCLGNCARSPSVMVDGEVKGDVTVAGLHRLLEGLR